MKIVLIYAKSQTLRRSVIGTYAKNETRGEYSRDEIYPPLGIATLAARLRSIGGYDVSLFDDSLDEIEDIVSAMHEADVVGISSLTPNAKRARELGLIARKEAGKLTVLGGPHPTTNPEYFLDAGAADICVQGEGDLTLPEILEHKDDPSAWGDIQGITYLEDGGKLHATPRRPLIKKMDEVPWPAYELYDMKRYFETMVTPGVPLMTSRGCPFSCTFCDAEMTPRSYRAMSARNTVDLMEALLDRFNPPQLFLFDDLFTIQRKRVIEICKEIVNRNLCFEWSCESRVDTVDLEMLRWMRRAGCVKVYYGLESGSPNVLLTMKKDVTPEKILHGAKLNRMTGMYFKFFILYGFPSDTEEDYKLTEELVAECRSNAISVSLLAPIPGTEVYEQIKDELLGDVTETEFHYWHHTEMWKHPRFSHEDLVAARQHLIEVHAISRQGWKAWLGRKWERACAVMRHPVLLMDMIEIHRRKKAHQKRIALDWGRTLARDPLRMQIPTVKMRELV
jgi:anaerobic magnesium-protoporphyrin IX monomethyl ester cyclase